MGLFYGRLKIVNGICFKGVSERSMRSVLWALGGGRWAPADCALLPPSASLLRSPRWAPSSGPRSWANGVLALSSAYGVPAKFSSGSDVERLLPHIV